MKEVIKISGIEINVDADNRYSLNDLYNAAKKMGIADENDSPAVWLKTITAQMYIDFLTDGVGEIPTPLTIYAVKELVYSYAIWLSVEFHHEVIQTYDRIAREEHAQLEALQAKQKTATPKDPDCVSSVIGGGPLDAYKFYKVMQDLELINIQTEYRPIYRKLITDKGWAYCQGYSKDGIIRIEPEMHNELMAMVAKFASTNQIDWREIKE